MAKKHFSSLLERYDNKLRSQSKNLTTKIKRKEKEDKPMLEHVMKMDHQCTAQQALQCAGRFCDSGEDWVIQGQTGETQSRKT